EASAGDWLLNQLELVQARSHNTLTIAEADEIIAEAVANDRMLTVYHNRRWDGDFATIRHLVESGQIGEIFEISCGFARYRRPGDGPGPYGGWWLDKEVSGGVLYPWGPHLVDWMLQLVGRPVQSVQGFAQKKVWQHQTNEDHAQAILRFEGGAMGEVFVSDISAVPRPRWRIVGTQGGILDDGTVEGGCKLFTRRDGQTRCTTVPWDGPDRWGEFWWDLADHMLRADPLRVTPAEARRVVGVLEAAGKSSETGRPESFPDKL
ncbi:MAG: Gfo/Idh/MocA family protein, partial [Planctomycetota bacterium]